MTLVDLIVVALPCDTDPTGSEPGPSSAVLFYSHSASSVIHSVMTQPSLSVVALLSPCPGVVVEAFAALLAAVICLIPAPLVVLQVYQSIQQFIKIHLHE